MSVAEQEISAALRRLSKYVHIPACVVSQVLRETYDARRYDLPRELHGEIMSFLSIYDTACLALTCKLLMSYKIEYWGELQHKFFLNTIVPDYETDAIKAAIHYSLFYRDQIYDMESPSRKCMYQLKYQNLLKHEKGMVWLEEQIEKDRNNERAYRTNLSDYRSRERLQAEMYEELSEECKHLISYTFLANKRDRCDIPYYTVKKPLDMRFYGFDEECSESDEMRKWLEFEYDSDQSCEFDTEDDEDENYTYNYHRQPPVRYRVRPEL